jgi:hypothetical protein
MGVAVAIILKIERFRSYISEDIAIGLLQNVMTP